MEVDVFIHGAPKGEDFWGPEEDKNYITSYYTKCLDDFKCRIESHELKGQTYYYYHFLLYNTVVDFDGRAGSYFGLSLRLDTYCNDVKNMYQILDMVFQAYVLNYILKQENGRYKFLVPGFKSTISGHIKRLEKFAYDLFESTFKMSHGCFVPLSPSRSNQHCPRYNLYDCTIEEVQSALLKYNHVEISPFFPDQKSERIINECKEKVESLKQSHETQIKSLEDEIKSRASTIRQYKEELNDLRSCLVKKEDEVCSYKKKVEELNSSKNSTGEMSSYFISPSETKKDWSSLKELLAKESKRVVFLLVASVVNSLILIYLLIMSLISIVSVDPPSIHPSISIEGLSGDSLFLQKPYIVFVDHPVKNGKWRIEGAKVDGDSETERSVKLVPTDSKRVTIEYLGPKGKSLAIKSYSVSSDKTHAENSQSHESPSSSNIRIDINEYTGSGPLEIDKQYTVTALNKQAKKKLLSSSSKWEVFGGKIISGSNSNPITIIPTSTKVTIKYRFNGEVVRTRIVPQK